MAAPNALSASLENYLETLLVLTREEPVTRVRDIAKKAGVSMPSVNTALKRLCEQGLVRHEPYEFVTLTEKGRQAAGRVRRRHQVLRRFLVDILNVPEEIAEEDACQMEHGLHPVTVTQLQRFLELLDDRDGEDLPCVRALQKLQEVDDEAGHT